MPRVTEEHRAARREQILVAARKCVAAEGFHKTTMAHVIEESGLSAGAVYGYFRSKDDLILAIAGQAFGLVDRALEDLLATEPTPSPAQVVETLTGLVVEQAEAGEVDLTRVIVAAWAEAVRNDSVRVKVARTITSIRGRMVDLVRAQQEAGHLDPAANAEHVAQSLMGLLPGFILQRLVVGDVTPESFAVGIRALSEAPRRTAS
jgi:AcrR family transcriptional regulator